MKIGVIGNYGATNVGDNAILSSILSQHSSHQFTVFSAHPEKIFSNQKIKKTHLFPLGFRSFFGRGFKQPIKNLRGVDAVIFGGGGLMQDDYLYACFLWAWQIFWVKFFNKPYFIYATGVGPLKTKWGKRLTRYVYKDAVGITVRDQTSFNQLRALGIEEKYIEVTADPAFLLSVPERESTESRQGHTYLISLRPWLRYNPTIINEFTRFLSKIKHEKKAKFVFVSMQRIKEKDRQVIDPIIERVGGELFIPNDYNDLCSRLQKCEFAIGMRYHFLLAAILTRTPALAVSYAHKVDSLFNGSSLEPYHLSLSELSAHRLETKMSRLSVDYNNIKVYQKNHLESLKNRAKKNIEFFNGFVKVLTDTEEADNIAKQ